MAFSGKEDAGSRRKNTPKRGFWSFEKSEPILPSGAPTRPPGLQPGRSFGVRGLFAEPNMPYALFSNDAKLSRAYPTEADVWKFARKSGLVIDAESEADKAGPHPVLDNDYEIRPCAVDPQEDPARNQADAERESDLDLQLNSTEISRQKEQASRKRA